MAFDDLDAAQGQNVPAEGTYYLGWDGEWFELDMTTAHGQELFGKILPYIDAARRTSQPPEKPIKPLASAVQLALEAGEVPMHGSVPLKHAVGFENIKDYWTLYRQWAVKRGYEVNLNSYYYPVARVREYEEHLDRLDQLAAEKAG